ncbi:MAG: DMT family transporter [Alphaproteobacteria bacterium]|nr:DMT family transporter [Alphaproteobacteria bacterium]
MATSIQSIKRWGQGLGERFLPWLCLGFMGMAWGLTFSLGKIAVESGIKPFGLTFYQVGLAGLILVVIVMVRRKPVLELKPHFGFICLIAMLGAAVPSSLFYFAAPHVQAGVLAITVALIPLLTYGFSIPLKIEGFSKIRFLGLAFGVLAMLFIAVPDNSLPNRAAVPWILLACLSSVSYAAENILLGFRSAIAVGPIRMAMGMNLISAVVLLPVVYATDSFYTPQFPLGSGDYALVGLSVITVIAYSLFVLTVARYGAVFASQTGYTVTLCGVFWGIMIFGESHSLWVWCALVAMIIGLALVLPKTSSPRDGG